MAEIRPSAEDLLSSSGSSEGDDDILNPEDDDGWEDAEPDEEEEHFISLLDDEVFPDIKSMLKHCKDKYNFDFLDIRQKLHLDFYGSIKLVNYIRSQVHSGQPVTSAVTEADIADESFLKPVLEDDAVLFNLDELPNVKDEEYEDINTEDTHLGNSKSPAELASRVVELEEALRKMQTQFDDYRSAVARTLDDRWNERTPSGSTDVQSGGKRDDDSHYFSSYSYNGQFCALITGTSYLPKCRYP